MKIIKLISVLLTVLMLMSAFAVIAGAAAEAAEGPQYRVTTGNGKSNMAYTTDGKEKEYLYAEGKYVNAEGKTVVISTPEEKIALMDYRYGTDKFELYVDAYSGEVAIRDKKSGEILFTNPYNIGQSDKAGTKNELLSQLVVNYTIITEGSQRSWDSYTWASLRNQIKVKNIKGGIRVEYAIGQDETRTLLPRLVKESAFLAIATVMKENLEKAIESGAIPPAEVDDVKRDVENFYDVTKGNKYKRVSLYDEKGNPVANYDHLVKTYPILEQNKNDKSYAVYELNDTTMGDGEIKKLESILKTYCPDYTFEQMDADHAEVNYEAKLETYPIFKMALEYTVEDSGLVVTLPSNGIRFDETAYRLNSISVLPYIGAGMNPNAGYTFFPDGAGTLFDFQDIALSGWTRALTGKVYGPDFAYHTLSGNYEEVIRYPVFGIYEQEERTREVTDKDGNVTTEKYTHDRGYVAIVEEGDALMELTSYHGGISSDYNSIKMSVLPRPTDTYNMADSVSTMGGSKPWTVVSDRKYTGSYSVRYIMLTDDEVAKDKGITDYYETSYIGMAFAYRDYLEKNGMIKRLTEEDIPDGTDIPLYIETFGALETTEKFLSVPINVMTPLTSFGDIQKMYKDLKGQNITNVNFIMTGYTDGGMTGEKIPYGLKWESAVKKEMDFDELTEYAKDEGFGLFPDFDFVFSDQNTLFDGLTLSKHAAKTIDDRYTSKREYSATKHTYVSYFELVISSAYFDHFYEKFIPKYAKTNPIGISVSTLGSYLNSDFDEDEPYNRDDSKQHTIDAFEYIDTKLKDTEIMTSGGNYYTWKYIDHLTDVSLDSSRFFISSASVPFLGIVLHGYVQFAGSAVNMDGNLDYAFLKALENGASLKFILSYRNTSELKEYETLSKYYSVDYNTWYDQGHGDLVSMYKDLNEVLKDVQTSVISDHKFIDGVRIPDDDELEADGAQAVKDAIAYEKALANATSDNERNAIYEARKLILEGTELLEKAVATGVDGNLRDKLNSLREIYDPSTDSGSYATLLANTKTALKNWQAYQQYNAVFSDISVDGIGAFTTLKYDVADYFKDMSFGVTEEKRAEVKKYVGEAYLNEAEKLQNARKVMNDAKAAYDADSSKKQAYDDALAAYEAQLAVVQGMRAGVDVTPAMAIKLMTDLEATKQAWIDAEKLGDANVIAIAKQNFEAKHAEVCEALKLLQQQGLAYEISYDTDGDGVSERVGGVRAFRDMAKEDYEEAIDALNAEMEKLYAQTKAVMDEAELYQKVYTSKKLDAAYELILEKGAYTETERAALKAKLDKFKELLSANSDFMLAVAQTGGKEAEEAYTKYLELREENAEAGVEHDLGHIVDFEIYDFDLDKYFAVAEYTWSTTIVPETPTVVEKPVYNSNKYKSDDNKLVLEKYSNGTELILNFNSYRVETVVNGASYTIDAYGYAVIKKA